MWVHFNVSYCDGEASKTKAMLQVCRGLMAQLIDHALSQKLAQLLVQLSSLALLPR